VFWNNLENPKLSIQNKNKYNAEKEKNPIKIKKELLAF
jgi:hypothetical protein